MSEAGRSLRSVGLKSLSGDEHVPQKTSATAARSYSLHPRFVSWIDHRFLRQGFDQGLTRVEELLYFVLITVSNSDGVSFYSDEGLCEVLEIQHGRELTGASNELVARELIAFKDGIYQVLNLPPRRARS